MKSKPKASSIFDYEDPPDVVKLIEKDLNKSSLGVKSMAKMAKRAVAKEGSSDLIQETKRQKTDDKQKNIKPYTEQTQKAKPLSKARRSISKEGNDKENINKNIQQTHEISHAQKSKPKSKAKNNVAKEGSSALIKKSVKRRKKNKPDTEQKNMTPYIQPTPSSSQKSKPESISNPTKKDRDEDSDEDCNEEYIIDLDELLKLPERPADGSKTVDEICDEMDKRIAEKQKAHEEEMEKVDKDIEGMKRKRAERKARMKENAKRRNILETKLTEPKLRKLFKQNLEHLQGVWDGQVESSRHNAFHQSTRTRHALYYMMITDPFTDDQLDWTLDEIEKVWMKTKEEHRRNNEYVWKVLLAECFIKFYMDMFQVTKDEAVQMIGETPLHKKDQLKDMRASDASDNTDSD